MEYVKNERFAPEEQNDIVDNAVYHMLLTMLGETEETFPWDMSVIGPLADVAEEELCACGHPLCRPYWEDEIPCYELMEDGKLPCGRKDCPALIRKE